MNLLPGMKTDCNEGNISWFPKRQSLLSELIRQHKPKQIIQIGFNMGHSAFIVCDTIASMKQSGEYDETPVVITVFDICEHECTVPNFEILSEEVKKYGIYMNLIPGSSLETIPQYLSSNEQLFDFVEVDGGHTFECVTSDTILTASRLQPGGVVYVDDYKSTEANIPDVDRGVDSINWENFTTNSIDGAFWAINDGGKITKKEHVNHPGHYGGEENPYEAIKVIDAWDLGFSLGNSVKYISRAGKKDPTKELEDLKKALWYLDHHVKNLESKLK